MATTDAPKALLLSARFPWLSPASREQVKEYAPTLLTEFAVMLSQVGAYKLAAHYLGKQGFAEYALARRTITLLIPIPMLGLTVGLPRYIGFSNGRKDPDKAARHYGATLWCVGGSALICIFLINFFSSTFAYLFFGDRSYRFLAFPFGLMILGLCAHTIVCGYFRGHLKLNWANGMQFINLALGPTLVFLFFHRSLSSALTALGVIWISISAAGLSFTPLRPFVGNNLREMAELLRYGIQRVPGDFMLMALFTLPSTVVAHLRGVQEAGFVAFGMSVIAMVGALFAPIGLVLLPKATLMFAEGAKRDLRQHLRMILRITISLSLTVVTVIWLGIPKLVQLFFGTNYQQVVPIVRVLVLAAVPYSLYLVFRNLVDAYHEYGVTAAILSAGLLVFLIGSYFGSRLHGATLSIQLSFSVAQAVIALLAGLECRRILADRENS